MLLLGWLAVLASGEDRAPLPYTPAEISKKFGWPEEQTREAAELAAAAGYLRIEADTIILTDPRERRPTK